RRRPRPPAAMQEPAAEAERRGVRALAVRVDVRDDAQVEAGIKTALDKMGRVDFLINNAGALHWRNMTESPMKKYDLVNGVNARASYACAYFVLPAMIQQKYGHILMMSPPVDPKGAGGKVAYAISKFGMTLI